MEFFGIDFEKKATKEKLETFSLGRDVTADAAIETAHPGGPADGVSLYSFGALTVPTEEAELIRNYRQIATAAEVDEALQEIRNEIFIFDIPNKKAFDLAFYTENKLSETIQNKIKEEFDNIYNLLDFQNKGIQYFDDWYIDSKLVLNKIIDKDAPKKGIKQVSFIDPLKIRKVRQLPVPDKNGIYDLNQIREFYVYSNLSNFNYNEKRPLPHDAVIQGLKIRPESICYINSNLYDRELGIYIGHLKKAILPFNNLKMMEDSMIIYRVVRAPQRRIFYIDVGMMQTNKAEEHIKKLQAKFKNRLVYDSRTGTLADRRNVMSMIEDYWLGRRSDGRTTEVQTLDGQQSQDILEEVEYLRQKLWRSLNVPLSRFSEQPMGFIFGKGMEIQRDEYRFKKFLNRIRENFLMLFEDLLRTQLILKRIIHEQEWKEVRDSIYWEYAEDNAFVEYKESEIFNNRLDQLQRAENYIGKFFSKSWVMKNILKMSDDDIKQQEKEIKEEPKPEQEEERF